MLRYFRGDSLFHRAAQYTEFGEPKSIVGKTIFFTVKVRGSDPDSIAPVRHSFVAPNTALSVRGIPLIEVPSSIMSALAVGRYEYDVQVVTAGNPPYVVTPEAGPLIVEQDVTYDTSATDSTPPTITALTMPAEHTNQTVPVTLTDDGTADGWFLSESPATPALNQFVTPKPTQYAFNSDGAKTLYGWAKDTAGNISTVATSNTCTIDTIPPTVTAFVIPATSGTTAIAITTLTTNGAAFYMITESATPPAAAAAGWQATPPSSYDVGTEGAHTLYAWAKDTAGNVSAVYAGQACTVDKQSVINFTAAVDVTDEGMVKTVYVERTGELFGALQASVSVTGGTATPTADFTLDTTTLNWASLEGGTKPVQITVVADQSTEGPQDIILTVAVASGAGIAGDTPSTVITINDTSTTPPASNNPYFVADYSPVSGQVAGASAPLYNFSALDTQGVNSADQAFTHEGVAAAGYSGGTACQIGFLNGGTQSELRWDAGGNRNYQPGARLVIRGTFRTSAAWRFGSASSNLFSHKFIIVPPDSPANGTNRFISHFWGRMGAWNNPVLRQNGGALNTEASFGFVAGLFDNHCYGALAMRAEDGDAEFTPPAPIPKGEVIHYQMVIQTSSAQGATDAFYKLYVNTNDEAGGAGPRHYRSLTGIARLLSQNLPVGLGAYLVDNAINVNGMLLRHERFELDTAFDPNWCPWDSGVEKIYEGWNLSAGTTAGFVQWDSQGPNDAANVTMVDDLDFIGGRALNINLTQGSTNNRYCDFTFGNHPLKGRTAVSEFSVATSIKLSSGYTPPATDSQKLFALNLCNAANGDREFQVYGWIAPSGELKLSRAWFASDIWAGENVFNSGYTPTPGVKDDVVLRVKPNDPGVANGILQLSVNGTLRINLANVDIRGNTTHAINKLVVTGHTSGGASSNGYLRIGRLIGSTQYPGVNA